MPSGYPKSDDPEQRLDQLAETAHNKRLKDILSRMPHQDTVEGHSLVGKVRRAVKSHPAD